MLMQGKKKVLLWQGQDGKRPTWFSGSKAQKYRVELLSSMYEGHENNAMLVNIRTGAKHN